MTYYEATLIYTNEIFPVLKTGNVFLGKLKDKLSFWLLDRDITDDDEIESFIQENGYPVIFWVKLSEVEKYLLEQAFVERQQYYTTITLEHINDIMNNYQGKIHIALDEDFIPERLVGELVIKYIDEDF